ncbi:sigma-70 family RNA polymerase sigma factor [Methylobacterium nodulans]|uniref:RNA polymerase sigma factor n=1 Tax=Methylobacterium nodulans (strain LMG 21967 / CNCM I-2342 / ORS 2060) TaxID=460265 RepID=B8IJK3_METNO|nr:sigma-70 family RNA polymerase sigma factor [Methylobacterium nodulans]ACL58051.1 RNA polymerase, sigma-24 subunit, ECF subfamily [Methylobacterium nodulans ORS 2060]
MAPATLRIAAAPRTHSDGRTSAPRLSRSVRKHLGSELRALYATVLEVEPSTRLLDLITRLTDAFPEGEADTTFRNDLLSAVPALHAFALSLAVNPTRAEDLVQETLLRAWEHRARFEPGTNFKAWLFTILRNQFYGDCRKRRREVEDVDGVKAGQVVAPAAQEASCDLRRVWDHLGKLPPLQREALILVAAQGLTYEAAAELIGCEVGTVKSRVSRARSFLAGALWPQERASPA